MKMIVYVLLIVFLTVSLCAQETCLSTRVSVLKDQAYNLDQRINGLRKGEHGDSYEEDFFLTDFFQFVERGETNFPDALTHNEKEIMLSVFEEISSKFSKAESTTRADIVEVTYGMICDKIDHLIEKILFVPVPVEKSVRKKMVVSLDAANVRSGPGTSFDSVTIVYKGDILPVLDEFYDYGENKTWYNVTANGLEGWISEKCVVPEGSGNNHGPVQGYVNVTVYEGNVRRTPSLSGTVVGIVAKDDRLPWYEKKYAEGRNWYEVKISDGTIGWISENCLDVGGGSGGNLSSQAQKNVKWAEAAVGKSSPLYGYNTYNSDTQYGVLACAAVVSAIIIKADVPIKYELYCPTLKNKLKDIGWECYYHENWRAGDVIFWRKQKTGTWEQKREKHVGVIVGNSKYREWMAVDNSSSAKKIKKRPVNRSYYPVNGPACRPN